ncbi:MAG TPA: pyruvate kinase, partial [Candidatus Binatia bacterium]|nr:pyruvate kinase [Candidatus Binatia bacterium]
MVCLKKTKIICTLGPATSSKQTVKKMFQMGMNGTRINTAYGNLTQYKSIIEVIREVADIPIIIDVKGPEIRILASERKIVEKGNTLEIGFNGEAICFNHDFY